MVAGRAEPRRVGGGSTESLLGERRAIELLAPAGEPRALRAALAAGADAVYFGLERWSARAFAGNFAGDTAVAAVDLAHLYDARAYLALNTLLKEAEVDPALAALEAPYRAGLDGLIVADLGILLRVREEYPDLPLHASTQLNTHSSAQLAALARLGCRRAVLARELSLTEIAALEPHGLELEAFVHGALCYGYSGDCLLSSMVGGRSGNRGRCSQSCRLRYEVRRTGTPPPARRPSREPDAASAGAERDEGAAARVLSTSDLAAIGLLPRLIAAGVTSFKIEGRMKDPAYVGVTTAVYREAVDAALEDPAGYAVRPEWLARLEQSFSRGFSVAHLEGRHHEVRSGGRGGHRGVLVGRVSRVDEGRGEVEVRLTKPVAAGDLVCVYTSAGQTEPLRLEGGGEDRVTLRLRERVGVKDRLFRLAAAAADELAQDLITARVARRPILLRMALEGSAGQAARLTVAAQESGLAVGVAGTTALAPARTAALTAAKARDALGALGGTPYRLDVLEFALPDGLFLPVGELKELRRRALAELDERRLAARRRAWPVSWMPAATSVPALAAAPPAAAPFRPEPATAAGRIAPGSSPAVVLRLRPGERPLAAPGVCALCLDLLAGDAPAAVVAASTELRATGLPLRVRLPEVLFDRDEPWWRAILALPWQGVYARHLGIVGAMAEGGEAAAAALILEFPVQGLSAAAAEAAAELAGRRPAAVVARPETSLEEIAGLAAGPFAVEVVAFGRQQVLHTRDLLGRAEGLCAAPGPGEHVGLTLTDAKGYEFPATVDAGGTRLFNARVTNLAANLDELAAARVAGFVVVQSDLDAGERAAFLSGGLTALAACVSRERSTTGHLFRGVA